MIEAQQTPANSYAVATKSKINNYRSSELCQQLCGPKPFGSRHWEYPWCIEQSEIINRSDLRILDIAPDFTFPYASILEEKHKVTFIDLAKRQWSDTVRWGAKVSELANKSDYRIMDARDMSFPDKTFDLIFCISVLEHIVCPTQDPDTPQLEQLFKPQGARPALQEMRRCLKPGGKLLLTVDIYQGPRWKPLFDQWHIKEDLISSGFSLPKQCTINFNQLMKMPDIFLSHFHGPYFTIGFALSK